ncbi:MULTISPECIES: 2TM domain-containing protein [Flavobacterium]|uniref:2TM domain-containing protein n=1 Tax=Flavobacterium TaxID=237 RepID=UPI001FCC3013|nr:MULTISPECIES: 2TM domain-containing protein [Flavobacterium]UOK41187.1 2TM domain-containing protein [Flavobacterium enshiense]
METNYNEREQLERAKKRVQEIKGFYGHLAVYVSVNIFFLVINLLTSPKDLWFFWPMLGWGIGVTFHGLRVFNCIPFFGNDWEEKKIREFMREEELQKIELKDQHNGK